MFGYDFMVDTNFNVWLIEVNSSPSMEYSTHVTTKLVKEVLTQIPHLVYDNDNGKVFDDEVNKKVGKFELIYSE
jgi:tubulin monoglycylase TTLL3/8